eukprot:2150012-Pleurochrysis_carterae.AAC.1
MVARLIKLKKGRTPKFAKDLSAEENDEPPTATPACNQKLRRRRPAPARPIELLEDTPSESGLGV